MDTAVVRCGCVELAAWSRPPALLGPGQPDSSRPPTQPGPGPASVGSGPGLPTLLVTSHTILPRSDNTPLLGLGLHCEHSTVIVFSTSRQIQLRNIPRYSEVLLLIPS